MCGINVVYRYGGLRTEDSDLVRRMNAEMFYRGPDGEGVWSGQQVALGMRRLAIIGLQGGDQPLFNEDRSLVLVCNGEIYNDPELRQKLISKGHVFRSTSDCESILHLYEEYEEECVHHLRGMYAFALWDEKNKRLLVARDRVGEVPLYFAETPMGVYFSSELKAIAKHALARKEPDYDVIRQTLRYSYPVDLRKTFIDPVRRLLPGEYAVVDQEGLRFRRYWKPRYNQDYKGTFQNAQEDVLNMLRESVRLRLRSEVPVGILLSGGVDSSAIAALMAGNHGNVVAITAGYRGMPDCDESETAKALAKSVGIPWERIELDEEDFARCFEELSEVIDEPVGDKSAIAQWAIYRKAREKGLKVLLSGNGGDELFFGYPFWNRVAHQLQYRNRWEALRLQRRRHRVSQKLRLIGGALLKEPHDFLTSFTSSDRSGMLMNPFFARRDRFVRSMKWPDELSLRAPDPFQSFYEETQNGYELMASALFSVWLPLNCLHLSNKLGLGASVELRAPMVDHKLVDLVFSLPLEWRFSKTDPKMFLKKILRGLVPDGILDSKKRGFMPPDRMIDQIVTRAGVTLFERPATDLIDLLMVKLVRQYSTNI